MFCAVIVTLIAPRVNEFWTTLQDGKEEQDVLTIPEPWLGQKENGYKLFVRKCYRDLWEIITTTKANGIQRILITGNPGIGKTHFVNYALFNLKKIPNVVVVLELAAMNSRFLFTQEGVQEGTLSEFEDELADDKTWYFVDGKPALRKEAFTILTTSPQKGKIFFPIHHLMILENYKMFISFPNVTQRTMPVWTLNEIKSCRAEVFPHIAEVKDICIVDKSYVVGTCLKGL